MAGTWRLGIRTMVPPFQHTAFSSPHRESNRRRASYIVSPKTEIMCSTKRQGSKHGGMARKVTCRSLKCRVLRFSPFLASPQNGDKPSTRTATFTTIIYRHFSAFLTVDNKEFPPTVTREEPFRDSEFMSAAGGPNEIWAHA
jgi:hypothetical protein